MKERRLDLSFSLFDPTGPAAWRADLAALMVGVAARPGAGRTAPIQSGFRAAAGARLFAPVDGAFNGRVAASLMRWRRREGPVYRSVSGDLQAPPLSGLHTFQAAASPIEIEA